MNRTADIRYMERESRKRDSFFRGAKHLLLVLTTVTGIILQGCGGKPLVSTQVIDRSVRAEPAAEEETDTSTQESAPSLPAQEVVIRDVTTTDTIIHTLIKRSRTLASKGKYTSADIILQETAGVLEIPEISTESKLYSKYFKKIIHTYAEFFPESYNNRLPEELFSSIVKFRMTSALDTIEFDSSDRHVLETIDCIDKIELDPPGTLDKSVLRICKYILNSSHYLGSTFSRLSYYSKPFREILERHSIPEDILYLPVVESRYRAKALSSAGAAGIWQFIKSTGRLYGLQINWWVDERLDPLKSTEAAAAYLSKLYDRFEDWDLALASYNCGEGRVTRVVKKDSSENFHELSLPKETQNYVPQFTAYRLAGKNPGCFSIETPETEEFNLDTVTLESGLNLERLAEFSGIPFDSLHSYNPHILKGFTPPETKGVNLYIPADKGDTVRKTIRERTEELGIRWKSYTINPGDNLLDISVRFDIPVPLIKEYNSLKSTRILAGKKLRIPVLNPRDRLYSTKEEATQGDKKSNSIKKGGKGTYTVKKGDNLSTISRHTGVPVRELAEENDIPLDSPVLHPGQKLSYASGSKEKSAGDSAEKREGEKKKGNRQRIKRLHYIKEGETIQEIASLYNVSESTICSINSITPEKRLSPGEHLLIPGSRDIRTGSKKDYIYYITKPEDTINRIASLFDIGADEIIKANKRINKGESVSPGDTLKIPDK
ncbi:MAG: LysM peptidoglycan-binding domain-containing protein [Chitinivibrionales bacterium]